MWIKKTKEEFKLDKEKGRFSLKVPLLFSPITIIATVTVYKTGFDKHGGFRPLTWTQILHKTPEILLGSLCVVLVVFVIQAFMLKSSLSTYKPTSKLCLKCGKVLPSSLLKCDCENDAELDQLENYKWEE